MDSNEDEIINVADSMGRFLEDEVPTGISAIPAQDRIERVRNSMLSAVQASYNGIRTNGVAIDPSAPSVRATVANDRHYSSRQRQTQERVDSEMDQRSHESRSNDPNVRGPYRAIIGSEDNAPKLNDNSQCVHCLLWYDRHDGRENIRINGCTICGDCARAEYVRCPGCSAFIHRLDGFPTHNSLMVCGTCRDGSYGECRNCRRYCANDILQSRRGHYYCPNCLPRQMNEEGELDEKYISNEIARGNTDRRYYNKDTKFFSEAEGKIIKSPRIFSAEIECYYPEPTALCRMAEATPKHMGIGRDGSLGRNGIELRTPILKGKAGEDFIKDVTDILAKEKFTTDKCCGLHIHLDGGSLLPTDARNHNPMGLKMLWVFFLAFEDIISSFLPKERRNNHYCRLMRPNFHINEIWNAMSLDDLEKIWYRSANRLQVSAMKAELHHSSRYHGFNIHCLLSQNHLEIRFHSGTTNGNKILEWVSLHQRVMDLAEAQALDYQTMYDAYNLTDMAEKRDVFFSILGLPAKSKAYFLSRAEKFADKSAVEDNLKTL